MTKSKFFRVAVEGATVDGRTIDRKWLEEMAATYNRTTYAARVNLEHIRGIAPLGNNNSPFGAYGDILSVKTETVDIALGGKTEKRLALFAEIEALDPLVELVRKGQKLYTSIEVNPSFADTGKAYLMGLAVTDTPASLGTEMLEFSAKLGANSPLARFKQQPGNHFSVATETTIELLDDAPNADPTGVFGAIKGLLERFNPPSQQPQQQLTTPPAGQQEAQQPAAGGEVAAIALAVGQMAGAIDKLATSTTQSLTSIRGEVETLRDQINATPQNGHLSRPISTGVTEQMVQTDC
ncbi:GPO family capsid scaffolding protein [Sphingopyxis sp. MC1]|uniref:GPO family capsid scaffolding protein n=1 Tax=Sphingopyxis sp. MC1 TaxID=1174684 RepID=UPI0002D1A1E5|nr:GPO family capsid scaffolding protein [Sphingopyxis sp. MC1]ENY81927.1 capsid scaffolding protein [Sphingopyxis sp. MC1]